VTDLLIVLTTVPKTAADEIASRLVEERLAACVNVQAPMTSTYRWKGRVEREEECQLVAKTTASRVADLERRLRDLHPYELPEFIVIRPASAGASYAAWVDGETQV
jgi:periplasmic divalent cation tolerance protein